MFAGLKFECSNEQVNFKNFTLMEASLQSASFCEILLEATISQNIVSSW